MYDMERCYHLCFIVQRENRADSNNLLLLLLLPMQCIMLKYVQLLHFQCNFFNNLIYLCGEHCILQCQAVSTLQFSIGSIDPIMDNVCFVLLRFL